MSSNLFKNLELVSKRFSTLGEMICKVSPTSIQIAGTEDGGVCYVKQQNDGTYKPLSSPAPINDAQNAVNRMIDRIQTGFAPVVIIGLNPGYELDIVYKHFKENYYDQFIPRRIYVVINSLECFYGWLKRDDRSEILQNEAIEFYWHEDVLQVTELIKKEETRSHLIIPVSSLPEEKAMMAIQSLADLFLQRQAEEEKLYQENRYYYEQQTDEELDKLLCGEGGRKPRMLIPSHASSTVVQYSVRDTKAMFEKEGWDVRVIHMKTDLSRWRVCKKINDFKPDVYLLVNHLRTQDESFYPPDMMFITWIQDTVSYINNSKNAEIWNEHVASKSKYRDLIIGYTDQIREYGYLEDRLQKSPMIVNKEIFKPVNLSLEEKERYNCDICFASNRSKETSLIVKEDLYPKLSKFGFCQKSLMGIHNRLWEWYRSEKTCSSYTELENIVLNNSRFQQPYNNQKKDDQKFIIQKIFWELNDVIYRHIVLEWIDEIGDIKLHLYGRGWDHHPKFKKYARGHLSHGQELNSALKGAKYILHLNSFGGSHQRIFESLAGKTKIISRYNNDYTPLNTKEKSTFSTLVKIANLKEIDDLSKFNKHEKSVLGELLKSVSSMPNLSIITQKLILNNIKSTTLKLPQLAYIRKKSDLLNLEKLNQKPAAKVIRELNYYFTLALKPIFTKNCSFKEITSFLNISYDHNLSEQQIDERYQKLVLNCLFIEDYLNVYKGTLVSNSNLSRDLKEWAVQRSIYTRDKKFLVNLDADELNEFSHNLISKYINDNYQEIISRSKKTLPTLIFIRDLIKQFKGYHYIKINSFLHIAIENNTEKALTSILKISKKHPQFLIILLRELFIFKELDTARKLALSEEYLSLPESMEKLLSYIIVTENSYNKNCNFSNHQSFSKDLLCMAAIAAYILNDQSYTTLAIKAKKEDPNFTLLNKLLSHEYGDIFKLAQ